MLGLIARLEKRHKNIVQLQSYGASNITPLSSSMTLALGGHVYTNSAKRMWAATAADWSCRTHACLTELAVRVPVLSKHTISILAAACSLSGCSVSIPFCFSLTMRTARARMRTVGVVIGQDAMKLSATRWKASSGSFSYSLAFAMKREKCASWRTRHPAQKM
jgi:hypothetical protein